MESSTRRRPRELGPYHRRVPLGGTPEDSDRITGEFLSGAPQRTQTDLEFQSSRTSSSSRPGPRVPVVQDLEFQSSRTSSSSRPGPRVPVVQPDV
ncbi:hypothetical protein NHX12_020355 [Muraenolepis orangiensis]|uniref:Uncharacterized protein n=1 Tax=Muraenolepis orangiensis TaxID=630683 RepID=A0A9Q0EUX1_9TELE|nr:hypothetical protein NHX12_020355 [Muraenolepis orangiensis]